MIYHNKSLMGLAVVINMSLAAPNPSWGKPSQRPQFMRLSLAGSHMGDTRSKHDPKARYFLIGMGDCDGAHMSLILTPDPQAEGIEWDEEEKRELPRVSLPRLRTGKGINIGETPSQVQHKLGKAPNFYSYDREKKEHIYQYRSAYSRRNGAGKGEKIFYTGSYKFRNGRLWSIHYSLNKAGGCG